MQAIIQTMKFNGYHGGNLPLKLLSARDADPGTHQKEKKSVLYGHIVAFQWG